MRPDKRLAVVLFAVALLGIWGLLWVLAHPAQRWPRYEAPESSGLLANALVPARRAASGA